MSWIFYSTTFALGWEGRGRELLLQVQKKLSELKPAILWPWCKSYDILTGQWFAVSISTFSSIFPLIYRQFWNKEFNFLFASESSVKSDTRLHLRDKTCKHVNSCCQATKHSSIRNMNFTNYVIQKYLANQ